MQDKGKKRPIVKCRVCKGPIDRDNEVDWTMGAQGWYYHTPCYENFFATEAKASASCGEEIEMEPEMWLDMTYRYLKYDLKIPIDWVKLQSQWNSFLKKKLTPKGMFFALKYFYDVQKNKPQNSKGGIGIVPYIYEESAGYWYEKEQHDRGICARIEQQILAQEYMKPAIAKRSNYRRRIAKTIDLSKIAEGVDE